MRNAWYSIVIVATIIIGSVSLYADTIMQLNAPMQYFSLPAFGESGYKVWELKGDQGAYVDEDVIEVQQMLLSTFSGDEILEQETTLMSPKAYINIHKSFAWSEDMVIVKGPGYTVVGKEWSWEGAKHALYIKKNVRVDFESEALSTDSLDEGHKEKKETVVQSESLDLISGREENRFYFRERVRIDGDSFWVIADRLKVISDSGDDQTVLMPSKIGAIRRMVADGNVVIEHEGRKATGGKVDIVPGEGKMILTKNPMVQEERGVLSGERIIFLKGQKQAIVEGNPSESKRATVILNTAPDFYFDEENQDKQDSP